MDLATLRAGVCLPDRQSVSIHGRPANLSLSSLGAIALSACYFDYGIAETQINNQDILNYIFAMVTKQIEIDKFDYDMPMQFGADRDFVNGLSPSETKSLVRNILYAVERHKLSTTE